MVYLGHSGNPQILPASKLSIVTVLSSVSLSRDV